MKTKLNSRLLAEKAGMTHRRLLAELNRTGAKLGPITRGRDSNGAFALLDREQATDFLFVHATPTREVLKFRMQLLSQIDAARKSRGEPSFVETFFMEMKGGEQ